MDNYNVLYMRNINMIWSWAQVISTVIELERLEAMAEYWQSDVPKSTVNHNRTNNCGIVQFQFYKTVARRNLNARNMN